MDTSKAVIAMDEHGDGTVLWYIGEQLRAEICEAGLRGLDLGLNGAPAAGIWIWEGVYVWTAGPWECPEDGQSYPEGTYRRPTEEEWSSIKDNKNPLQ